MGLRPQTKVFRGEWSTGLIARLLGCSVRNVIKQIELGRMKCYRLPGGKDRRVPSEYLTVYLKEQEIWDSIPPVVRYLCKLQPETPPPPPEEIEVPRANAGF